MVSDAVVAGPGGAEVFTDLAGRRWLAYHGWSPTAIGYRAGGVRSLRLDRVEVVGPTLVIHGPSTGAQPLDLGATRFSSR
jgi:hypothetical protein